MSGVCGSTAGLALGCAAGLAGGVSLGTSSTERLAVPTFGGSVNLVQLAG